MKFKYSTYKTTRITDCTSAPQFPGGVMGEDFVDLECTIQSRKDD